MSLEEIEAAIHEAAVEVGLFDSTFAYCGYAHCGYSVDGTAEIYRILIRYNLIGQSYELNSI